LRKSDEYQKIFGKTLWELFQMYELTEIMRQKDDILFAEALNALGSGSLTPDQIIMFRNCEKKVSSLNVLNVFTENLHREAFNNMRIKQNTSEENISFAIDTCLGNVNLTDKEYFLEEFKKKSLKDVRNLEHELKLKIGIRYIVTINTNVIDGFVNGATGTLMSISKTKSNTCEILWIKFDQIRVGQILKNGSDKLYKQYNINPDSNWIPIKRYEKNFSIDKACNNKSKTICFNDSRSMTCYKVFN